MKTKFFLAAMCLSLVLGAQAFADDAPSCRPHRVRGWLKAVFTVTCKEGPFCRKPPDAPAADAAPAAPADAAKDAPKPDAATPAPPAAK